jgi:hypothetical protein
VALDGHPNVMRGSIGSEAWGSGPPVASRGGPRHSIAPAYIAVFALAITIAGCGGSMTAPSGSSLDLSGTWSGVVGSGSGGGRALRVTWTASQTGRHVFGPAIVSTSPAVNAVSFAGTLTGDLDGSQLSLTFTAPPGSVAGFQSCTASARGTAVAGSGTISGTLDVTFASCDGVDVEPPSRNEFTLTKS